MLVFSDYFWSVVGQLKPKQRPFTKSGNNIFLIYACMQCVHEKNNNAPKLLFYLNVFPFYFKLRRTISTIVFVTIYGEETSKVVHSILISPKKWSLPSDRIHFIHIHIIFLFFFIYCKQGNNSGSKSSSPLKILLSSPQYNICFDRQPAILLELYHNNLSFSIYFNQNKSTNTIKSHSNSRLQLSAGK